MYFFFKMMAANPGHMNGNVSGENGGETSHHCHHKEGMEKLWNTGVYSDVKIHVKDKTFNCHKLILVAASSYFEAMFSSGMREAISGEITFHDMEPNIMQSILEFVYTGKKFVTEENVTEALEASVLLGIKTVSQMCENLLLQKLNVENCLEILELCYTHNCERLKTEILTFIIPNFVNVMKQNNFQKLKLNDLIQLIKSDELNVISEEIVVESVLKWAKKTEENVREQNLDKVLPYLRLGHLSAETLFSLKEYPVSPDVHAKLDEALKYRTLPPRRQEINSTVTEYRKSFPFEEVMVVVSSSVIAGFPDNTRGATFLAFSFLKQKWFKLANIPYVCRDIAACCHGNDIFLFGGRKERSKDVQRYNAATNTWTKSTSLCVNRGQSAVVAMTDVIYLIGGFSKYPTSQRMILSSIEKYNIASGRSEYCGDMPKATYGSSTAVSGRNVFLFGEFHDRGTGPDFQSTSACYMWNTVTNEFTLVTELPLLNEYRYFNRTVKIAGRIFMVQDDGEIHEFIEETGDCLLLTEMENWSYALYGTVPHRGHILIVGGRSQDEDGSLSQQIMSFNMETSTVNNYSHSLPIPLRINNCFKIEIDKKFLTNQA